MTDTQRCTATTKSGAPCRGRALASGLCRVHDPDSQEAMRAIQQAGGKARSNRARARREFVASGASTPAEMMAWLVVMLKRLSSGTITSGVASAAASVVRTWFDARKSLEMEEFERRLRELEART